MLSVDVAALGNRVRNRKEATLIIMFKHPNQDSRYYSDDRKFQMTTEEANMIGEDSFQETRRKPLKRKMDTEVRLNEIR